MRIIDKKERIKIMVFLKMLYEEPNYMTPPLITTNRSNTTDIFLTYCRDGYSYPPGGGEEYPKIIITQLNP